MTVQLLFFGILSDLIKPGPVEMDLIDGATVGDVRARVVAGHPEAASGTSTAMVAVNQSYSDDSCVLNAGDEVAFLPPVSGG